MCGVGGQLKCTPTSGVGLVTPHANATMATMVTKVTTTMATRLRILARVFSAGWCRGLGVLEARVRVRAAGRGVGLRNGRRESAPHG